MTDAFITPKEDDNSARNNTGNEIVDVTTESHNTSNKDMNNINAMDCVINKTIDNCSKNISVVEQNCSETLTALNEVVDKDTVMKYVSGKNDEIIPLKTSGHIRNSIKRKKRSLKVQLDNAISNSAPEIVNYETRHSPRDREIALPLQRRNNLIKNKDLADFNIETLHEPVRQLDTSTYEDVENYNQLSDRPPSAQENSDESRERDEYLDEERKPKTEDNSNETTEKDGDESREIIHDSNSKLLPTTNSNESYENEGLKLPPQKSNSKESQENGDSSNEKGDKSEYIEPRGRNIDSDEVEVYSNDRESVPRQRYFNNDSNEDERKINYPPIEHTEGENEKPKEELKQLNFDDSDKRDPKSFQDVDLGDFSYERIQVNNKGEVEAAKDAHENESTDALEEPPLNDKDTKENENPRSEYIEKKNNGEIKPVVEINTESNSNEFSDEDVEIKPPQKADLNTEDKSLETLLGVVENDSDEIIEKNAQNQEQKNGNVKQQFERVPLNYKHDKKTTDHNADGDRSIEKNENSKNAKEADGTLETLLPKDHHYDDKLNFKFDDVSIKLPDIKLPDDILSYNYESPYNKKGKIIPKGKDRFYHYSDEHIDENPLKQIPEYDDDRGYYRDDTAEEERQNYRKKQKQSQEDEDEHVDLYEKFVRERFGKRGSFEKRSEELRNEVFKPSNPKLGETIQQILKKSEDIQKQAEKSGDPKAGYMWTLEYGENL